MQAVLALSFVPYCCHSEKYSADRGFEQKVSYMQKIALSIEQSYGLCWRGRGWEDLGEWH